MLIQCKTKKEFNQVQQYYFDRGIYWADGQKTIMDYWNTYKENTVIYYVEDSNYLQFGSVAYYEEYCKEKIIPASKLLGTKVDETEKNDIKVGGLSMTPLPTIYGYYYNYPSATSSNPKPNLIKHKEYKFMSVVNNIFKSKERKALEFYGLVNGDGGLTDSGALELARFIYETDTELKAKFIAKIVEEYEAEKKSN